MGHRNVVIGLGGIGSWLLPKLSRLEKDLLLMDGDKFEKKNLDRQLIDGKYIGWNKAHAMSDKYSSFDADQEPSEIPWADIYFTAGALPLERSDLLWCCADNHACRREVLDACDLYGCTAILGANESTDAESYVYKQGWANGPNDPRLIYPEMLTDNSGDPLSPLGCVHAAQNGQVQTVLANGLAADLMLHLYWAWYRESIPLPFRPVHHKASMYSLKTTRICDRLPELVLEEELV